MGQLTITPPILTGGGQPGSGGGSEDNAVLLLATQLLPVFSSKAAITASALVFGVRITLNNLNSIS